MEKFYFVMPAYNEEANIRETIESWYGCLDGKADDSRIVIADSGSKDHTHSILLSLQEKYPKLEVLGDTDRQHGPKVFALYDYAIKNGTLEQDLLNHGWLTSSDYTSNSY